MISINVVAHRTYRSDIIKEDILRTVGDNGPLSRRHHARFGHPGHLGAVIADPRSALAIAVARSRAFSLSTWSGFKRRPGMSSQ